VTIRPGAMVAWWDGGQIAFGLVAAEEKQRLRLVRKRGKEERVRPGRIAAVLEATGPVPGADPAGRERAAARVAEVERRLRAGVEAVDVPLVWEIVSEGREAGSTDPLTVAAIADLAVESTSGEAQAVTLLAMLADGLHFVRRGDGWLPRDPEAVASLRAERQRLARREIDKQEFLAGLADAVASGTFDARGTDQERRYLEALEELAVRPNEVADSARNAALEALEASGSNWVRPHEGAFRLLRRMGRFASDDENLQVQRFGLRTTFPDGVTALARERAASGFEREGRRDLTGLEPFSIDAEHTREIDDLISIESQAGGGHRLGVHIADPAAFIEPGDPIDVEALTRGVTHYMPDLRLPMLPPAISEEASSLIVGEERPALSFLVDLDAEGEILDYRVTPSVVRCARRLSYVQADRMIDEADPLLARLAEIGRARQAARVRAGAVAILSPEVDLRVDGEGEPVLHRIAAESPSRIAVTEAMILTGAIAARCCLEAGLSAIYRRQAAPSEPPRLPEDGVWDAVTVRRVRRGMRRAETGLEPGPHAGLGLEAYVQASSPLRRYQDLAVHRQLRSHLRGRPPCYDSDAMRRIAATTERIEADARRAEETADDYWLLRYLERRVGETVEASVVDVDPRPVVQLDETLREQHVKGLVGVVPGQRVRLTVVRVEPRAGLLSLRPVD